MRYFPHLFNLFVVSLSTNPCQRLCDMDGLLICTNGSYPRDDGNCHAYFCVGSNGHCYHTPASWNTCPATLPPLAVREAEAIVSSGDAPVIRTTPPSTSARMVSTTTTRPTVLRPAEFLTPSAAADYIGAVVNAASNDINNLILTIGIAFSRASSSRWPSHVTETDAMDFWTRAGGEQLFSRARSAGCPSHQCQALMFVLGFMPLPNENASSGLLFLEQIAVMDFIETNGDAIRNALQE